MSEGPIKRERAAWLPPEKSTKGNARVCMKAQTRPTYCGRKNSKTESVWRFVSCEDCRAAARADGFDVPY